MSRIVAAALFALAASAAAQDSVSADSLAARKARFAASLKYQTGDVQLHGGMATLRGVGGTYRFLDGEQAGKVLRAWGNPVKENPLGMLVPAEMSPVDSGAWAIVITYQDDGYVSDSGASRINYAILGNQEPALHAHVIPRFADEPDKLRTSHPWAYNWEAAPLFERAAFQVLAVGLLRELTRMGVTKHMRCSPGANAGPANGPA